MSELRLFFKEAGGEVTAIPPHDANRFPEFADMVEGEVRHFPRRHWEMRGEAGAYFFAVKVELRPLTPSRVTSKLSPSYHCI
jgi:hypothetical protein